MARSAFRNCASTQCDRLYAGFRLQRDDLGPANSPVHHFRSARRTDPTFNDNTGTNPESVVGAVTLFSTFTGPDGGPKDFDIIIPLNHPFTYNPAGNLWWT